MSACAWAIASAPNPGFSGPTGPTARDNRAGGGGVSFADMQLSVVTNSGPFVVTSPNSAVTWTGTQRVAWNVAGTTNDSVRATNVNILLSLDGGHTFPVALAANTPNDGEEIVALPEASTSQARIRVEAVGNIFFDISDATFTLARPVVIAGAAMQAEGCLPANGAPDPGEMVTVGVTLQNISPFGRTNLTVELLATNGVLSPGAPQTFGILPAGAAMTNAFTFIVAPTTPCGTTVNALLRLRDETGDLGTASFALGIGQTTVAAFSAANPAVIRPALWPNNSPYPSAIGVSNVPGVAGKITVTLSNMTDFVPDAVDIVLVNPAGQSVLLMSDYPYGYRALAMPITTLTFDDEAPVSLRDVFPITSGSYRPTDYDYFPGVLPPPAPSSPHARALSVLHGSNPNGTWKLFVADHFTANFAPTNGILTNSRIAGGWSLSIQTSNTVCCAENDLLALTIEDSADPKIVGERLIYNLTVTNRGSSTVSGVTLADVLPPGVANVLFTSSQGACSQTADVITCNLGSLAPGAAVQVSVGVTPTAPGTMTNSATVSAMEPDGNLASNSATTLTTIEPAATFSIADFTVAEGDAGFTNAFFRVLLPVVSSVPVTVSYATSNGTASEGVDYIATNGTLTFAPGEISKTIVVRVLGDSEPEPDETFRVTLFDPVNAAAGRATGVGTIREDDAAISIGNVTLGEGNAGTRTMRFAVSLSVPEPRPITVSFVTSNGTATAGIDYAAQSGLLTFPPGSVAAEVAVTVGGDTSYENDETFFVILLNPTNAPLSAQSRSVATILNDDGLPGVVDHFAWSAIAPTQFVDLAFDVEVRALDAFSQPVVSYNNAVSLTALGPGQDTLVGTNRVSQWVFPLQSAFHDARLQSIYLAGEIGPASRITALALEVTSVPGVTLSNWTLRLKHTSRTNYPVAEWEGFGWTLVYQTNLSLLSTGWVTFPFSTPFDYDGTNHLMVDFSFNNAASGSAGQCRNSNVSGPVRSLAGQANGTAGDPLAWSGPNAPVPLSTPRIPNLRLTAHPVAAVLPLTASPFVSGVWHGEMLMPQAATSLVVSADDGDGHRGVSRSFAVLPSPDLDGDLLSDPWELRYFGSTTNSDGGPSIDADQDGASNRAEQLAGSNPTNAASRLHLTAELSGNDVRLRFTAQLGRSYRVERTASLVTRIAWEAVPGAADVSGTGAVVEVPDPGAAAQPQRFYRVRLN